MKNVCAWRGCFKHRYESSLITLQPDLLVIFITDSHQYTLFTKCSFRASKKKYNCPGSKFQVQNVWTINSVNKDKFKAQIMHNCVSLCSIMINSFQYRMICHIYLYDLGENKSVYVLLAGLSGFSAKNVQDPRSQYPAL